MAWLFICVMLLPVLLYIPSVQNFVKDIAVTQASKATGLNISINRILLRFPLTLNIDNIIIEKSKQDTLLAAGYLAIDIKLLPLLHGQIDVNFAELQRGKYYMLSEDQSMQVRADIGKCRFDIASIDLETNRIDAVKAMLDGGKVNLNYDQDKSVATPDTTKGKPWIITARDISLHHINYEMRMLPYIESLNAKFAYLRLSDGIVDTGKNIVDARYFAIDSADCRYLYPTAEYIKKHPARQDSVKVAELSVPWTITSDSIRLSNSHAIYAVSGAKPKHGIDMDYIEASDINIAIDSFFNQGSRIIVPIRELRGKERCGIRIASTSGIFSMDSSFMKVENLRLATSESNISGNAKIENRFFENPQKGKFSTDADIEISLREIMLLYPSIRKLLPPLPCRQLKANVIAEGSLKNVRLKRCDINMPGLAQIGAKGAITNPLDLNSISCNIAFDGKMGNLNFLKPTIFTDTAMSKMVNLPPLNLNGRLIAHNGRFTGDAYLAMASGDIVFDALWDGKATDYAINFNAATLPLAQILPTSHLQLLSAQGSIKGHGFDIFKKSTHIKAEINVDSLIYNSKQYYGLMLNGELSDGNFNAAFASSNPSWDFSAETNGHIERDHYIFSLNANINDLNLYDLKLSDDTSNGCCDIQAYGDIDLAQSIYEGSINLSNLRWTLADNYYYTDLVELGVESDSTQFDAQLLNNDLNMSINAQCNLDTLVNRFTQCSNIIMAQYRKKSINIYTLQNILPPFTCDIELGTKNIAQQLFQASGMKFNGFDCKIANDSTIYMFGRINQLNVSGVKLDTIHMSLREQNNRIAYNIHAGNREGTMVGVAAADLQGALYGNTIEALLTQTDFKNRHGFNVGIVAEMSDTTVKVNMFPKNPVIGYKEWEVNDHNNISFNYITKHFDADLILRQAESEVSMFTKHDSEHNEHGEQEDILLNIKNLQISDWLSLSPFAPPLSGILGSNIKVKYDGKNIWGDAEVELKNVTYNRRRVGDFELNTLIDLNPENGGTVATGNIEVNGRQCIVAFGSINDSTATNPFLLELELDKFPLNIANPFMPKDMAEISGNLDGLMRVTGSLSKPILDGYIQCDSTTFSMPVFGTTVNMPSDKLPVDSSIIKLNHYAIKGINGNPVIIDGSINAQDINNPYLSLMMTGENVQFVSAKQTRKSEIFGRGFVDIDTSVKGYLNNLNVNANISLLSGSNITYVMQTDVSTIAERHEQNIVKFVQFNDSSYTMTDSIENINRENSINMNVALNIQPGSTLSVYLSKNGNDRAEIQGSGDLLFSINRLGDQSLVGQYNIDNGYVRYTPPLISQKYFNFNNNSYVRWTGDVVNPYINLSAYENHKTNVTQDGKDSRIVNFKINMDVTNTVSNMDVKFDLSTNDDVTVQNELNTMSASQRSSQAINLLLYDTYTGTDTHATGNLSGNPLFSFLTARINNWAASTLKGISVSFGYNQYDQTQDGVSSREVKYSYQVSKSLFDDRFKIVVGGDYSPSTTSSEDIAKELFNDVSLEYKLNKSGNMYVRIFNHTGNVNMLEGKVTQTGVAFVYKRKLASLKHLFIFDVLKMMKQSKKDKKKEPVTESLKNSAIIKTEDSDTSTAIHDKSLHQQ